MEVKKLLRNIITEYDSDIPQHICDLKNPYKLINYVYNANFILNIFQTISEYSKGELMFSIAEMLKDTFLLKG